jgi:ATP-binding cassette subfamily B (MDR/TAP) protein 1
VLFIIIFGGGRFVAKYSRGVLSGYSDAATIAEEILSSVRTVQAFGKEEKLASLYESSLRTSQKAGYRKAFALALVLASLFTAMYLMNGLAFCKHPLKYKLITGEGSRLILSGSLNVGLLINVLFAMLVGSSALAQLAPRLPAFVGASTAAQKTFQTISRIPSIDSLNEGGQRPDLRGNIEFKNVSFIYPSRPEGTN